VWGVLQGASLAKILGLPRVSVFEFGVAGGAGLVNLERIAELVEQKTGVGIDIYGFDTGKGLPKPKDHRDVPYMWEEATFRWTNTSSAPVEAGAPQTRARRAQGS
jgi:hypothetical protein